METVSAYDMLYNCCHACAWHLSLGCEDGAKCGCTPGTAKATTTAYAQLIRRRRVLAGLSLRDVAAGLDLSDVELGEVDRGLRMLDPWREGRLVGVLGNIGLGETDMARRLDTLEAATERTAREESELRRLRKWLLKALAFAEHVPLYESPA
jgi:transcriptional regulator with XRE-family HTH domain